MKTHLILPAIFTASLLSFRPAPIFGEHQPISFTAIGCGPYKPQEELDLIQQVARENRLFQSEFMVHLGDIMSGATPGTEDRYSRVAGILKKLHMPTFIVVGDNEWNDKKDPDLAWKYWTKYFMNFHDHWLKGRLVKPPYSRIFSVSQQAIRPENFAFVRKGVLFIGINLPGGRVHDPEEWATRMPQNAEWVKENLERHGKDVRAAVVFAQATPRATQDAFFVPFRAAAKSFGKPVLYIHADGHRWVKHNLWPEKNILRVQTDQVDITEPVLVTVKTEGEELFEFDRRYLRGPYLAMGTPDSMTIVWRTAAEGAPSVRYGSAPDQLFRTVAAGDILTKTTEAEDETLRLHSAREDTRQFEARVSNLTPETKYYYAVYSGDRALGGPGKDYFFTTSPPAGSKKPFRFWVVGDSGTGGQAQADVHNAMRKYVGRRGLDFYMHVGDMAYGSGTDWEFQHHFFTPYTATLRNTVCWPTMGNHEGKTSKGATAVGPYYDCYVLPTEGEAGGVASGTEAYYSFDYANAHFVCLDSHDLDRLPTGDMSKWLEADLDKTKADWLIAYFHHPPYTKGSHDSDIEQQLIEMRQHIVPILESVGVDLVLTGHSHIYERSMLMDGAYQTPTVAEKMILDDGSTTYRKSAGLNSNEGTIHVVTGHGGTGIRRKGTMPVMKSVVLEHGSVIIDIDGDTLTGVMVNSQGRRRDRFRIIKRGTVRSAPIAKPKQLPWFVNFKALAIEVKMGEPSADGTTQAELKIPGIPLKGVLANIVWSTKGTSWKVEPAEQVLELQPDTPASAAFKIQAGQLFPIATPQLTFKTKKKTAAGTANLVIPPYRKMTIPRLKSAPKIDGLLPEVTGSGLKPNGDMIEYNGRGMSKNPTEFFVGLYQNQLYVAIINHASEMNKMKIMERLRDGAVWQDDCDEIFIQRDGVKDYFQIIVSSANAVYDAINGWTPASIAWNAKVVSAVKIDKDRWVSELLIPLDMLGPPVKKGDVLRFNICRNNPIHKELSQWSHTNKKSNHAPQFFGRAVVGE